MVDSYLSTKFGINLFHFWENAFYGRTTTTEDGRLRHGISSADTVKQS